MTLDTRLINSLGLDLDSITLDGGLHNKLAQKARAYGWHITFKGQFVECGPYTEAVDWLSDRPGSRIEIGSQVIKELSDKKARLTYGFVNPDSDVPLYQIFAVVYYDSRKFVHSPKSLHQLLFPEYIQKVMRCNYMRQAMNSEFPSYDETILHAALLHLRFFRPDKETYITFPFRLRRFVGQSHLEILEENNKEVRMHRDKIKEVVELPICRDLRDGVEMMRNFQLVSPKEGN